MIFSYQHRPIKGIADNEIVPNSLVVAFKPEDKKYIGDNFNNQVIDSTNTITEYKIIDRKSTEPQAKL